MTIIVTHLLCSVFLNLTCEVKIFFSIHKEMKKCITKKWDGVKDQAKKNSIRQVFFKMLKRVVNAVGGNHQHEKQLYYKLIDHKSTTKAKVLHFNIFFIKVQYNLRLALAYVKKCSSLAIALSCDRVPLFHNYQANLF